MNYYGRRAPMNQDEFDTKFNYLTSARNRRHSDSLQQEFCFLCPFKLTTTNRTNDNDDEFNEVLSTSQKLWTQLKSYFPIIDSLLNYSLKDQLIGDLCAGASIGLYTIAQGLTCAFLAGVPPVCGLYTACVSSILYSFFGTSTQSQLSSNLILSFFIRNILERFSKTHDTIYLINQNEHSKRWKTLKLGDEQIDYAVTVTFMASILLALLYASRLRFLFSFISKHLLTGFSFGITIRVLFSQINHILHVKGHSCISDLSFAMALLYAKNPEKRNKCSFLTTMSNDSSSLLFPKLHQNSVGPTGGENTSSECMITMWDCFEYLNLYTLAIFVCAVLAIVFVRQLLSPFLQLKSHIPIPFEFFLIVISAFLAYLFDVSAVYDVETTQFIGESFRFSTPRLQLFRPLLFDSFGLALLIYAAHVHLCSEIAKEQKYQVETRQEAIALTSIGVVSSFFAGHPSGQSHNRNKMAVNADASSILCNWAVFLILIPITACAGTLFSYLPVCVFSAIIFNNAGEHLRELKSITFYWYISRTDVAIFVFSAIFACFSSDTSFALFLSIGFGLFTVVCRAQWPKFQQLVNVTGSGLYFCEKSCYSGSDLLDDPGITIFRFEAALLYYNTDRFCSQVHKACSEIKGQLLGVGIGSRAGSMKSNITLATAKEIPMRSTLLISGDMVPTNEVISVDQSMTKVLIIDFSSTPVVDTAGLVAMCNLFEELAMQKIRLLFACVNSTIRHRFKIIGGFDVVAKHYFYPSVQDAVLAAQQMGGGPAVQNIHMSVSLNGCRDLITLSNAPSNQDFINQQRQESASRMSIVETRFTPPLSIRNFQ